MMQGQNLWVTTIRQPRFHVSVKNVKRAKQAADYIKGAVLKLTTRLIFCLTVACSADRKTGSNNCAIRFRVGSL